MQVFSIYRKSDTVVVMCSEISGGLELLMKYNSIVEVVCMLFYRNNIDLI